jgi:hypothetical protein
MTLAGIFPDADDTRDCVHRIPIEVVFACSVCAGVLGFPLEPASDSSRPHDVQLIFFTRP